MVKLLNFAQIAISLLLVDRLIQILKEEKQQYMYDDIALRSKLAWS
jgi:hypothetical protein